MAETEPKATESGTSNQGVQLGVGTLIIIALIVSMCSGRTEVEKVQKDTAELKQQLKEINRKLDTLVANGGATTSISDESSPASADQDVEPSQNQ